MQQNQPADTLRRTAIKPKVTIIKKPAVPQQTIKTNILQRTTTQMVQQPIPQRRAPQAVQPQAVQPQAVQPQKAKPTDAIRNRINQTKKEFIPQTIRKKQPTITHLSIDLTTGQIEKIKSLQGTAKGQYLVILGNGPSLLEVDTKTLTKYTNIKLCTINVPDQRCWPTPYWAFYDRSQFHRHKELYHAFTGTIFNSTGIKESNPNSIKFKHIPGLGYSKDITKGVYIGMSSVFATLQIAMFMEFNKIYVVGCDMNTDVDQGQTHFYGINPDVAPKERIERFKKEANWYDRMVEVLTTEEKQKIVFCSKGVNKWQFTNHFTTIQPNETIEYIIKDSGNAS